MKNRLILLILFVSGALQLFAGDYNGQELAARDVIRRILPLHSEQFVVELMPGENADVFEIESRNGEIVLRGTTGVDAVAALNWYLKYYCNNHISWCGNNLSLPETLPIVPQKVRKVSPYRFRYYFNYCTHSYTMAFWDWERWEQEIDWMALNGINMPLAITGQEAVWRAVYHDFGLTDDDLEKFFVGPAYFGWGWMGNVDAWGGPLPQSWIDSHAELQKKILKRMRALGMKPVLPAFTGHVPAALIEKFPQAHIMKMKGWSDFEGTHIVDPMDPLFKEIGKKFIVKQNEMYETDHLYSADTFNEMDPLSTDLDYLARVSQAVSSSMVEGDSLAVNVMQTWLFLHEEFWTGERIRAYLEAVPNDRMILLDLFATAKPQWKKTKAFYGKPFIWCMLHNWGGKMGMYGRTNAVAKELPSLVGNPRTPNLVGIGLTPEGLMTNPFIYDLMCEMAWRTDAVDIEAWTLQYIQRRYGKKSSKAEAAWKILIKTLYDCRDLRHGPQGAHYCMRPTPQFSRGSFVRSEIFYKPADIRKALRLLLEASDETGDSDGYQYDIVDLTRQCMSDLSLDMHRQIGEAYARKNEDEYQKISEKWLSAMLDLDALLATRREFLLGNWLEPAKRWAGNSRESQLYEWNARNLITLWGDADSGLHDYAQKQWAGMMRDFYYPRWEMLIGQIRRSLKSGEEFDSENFKRKIVHLEVNWTNQNDRYPTEPTGSPLVESRKIFTKYLAD